MISTLLLVVAGSMAGNIDVAVVCPPQFQAELRPWVEHRVAQGHQLAWVDPSGRPEEVQRRLQALAKKGGLKTVVLVGDVPTAAGQAGVPTFLVPAKVNVRWGSEPEIASDHGYSDLDGDLLPDVTVGRISVRTPQELRTVVQKILAYEQSHDFSDWRRRVNFVACLGGFGTIADAAIEAAAKKLITDGLPAGLSTSMTYGSWRSPYCPDPRGFRTTTLDTLNQGCLFWVYIGHGHRRTLDSVRVPGGHFPIFNDHDMPLLQCNGRAPIVCSLACYTGQFDHVEDCLAEQMLRAPKGPVAVFAGSRVTMPYAMSVMGMGMLETCFGEEPVATLGEAVLLSKRGLMQTENLSINRRSLDSMASLVSPRPIDLAAERTEHLYLFNLIGDPLLRLPRSEQVAVFAPASLKPGQTIAISGESRVQGNAKVELIVRRDRLTFQAPQRQKFEASETFLESLHEIYQKSNNPTLASAAVTPTADGKFACTLTVPADATGPCHVRVFIEGKNSCGIGHCDVMVVR